MVSEWQYREADIPGLAVCIKPLLRRKWTAYGLWLQFHENTYQRKRRAAFPVPMKEGHFPMFSYQWQHFGQKQKRTHPTEYRKNFPCKQSCTHLKCGVDIANCNFSI